MQCTDKEHPMSSTTLTSSSSRSHTRAIERPQPLLSVLVWELRRFRSSRLFWIQALAFFCLSFFVTWAGHSDMTIGRATFTFNGSVASTSPWGMLERLPTSALLLLGLLLPFVNAEGVTRDRSRRTHELFMTTALPSWAYVWGRYLIGLLVSLGLALVLLAAYLSLGLVLHLTTPAYPLPAIGGVLLLWVAMVVPATFLLSSLSFALGTVFPRQANLVKIMVLFGWFVGALILPSVANLSPGSTAPAWYVAWDPTSAASAFGTAPQYDSAWFKLLPSATSVAQMQQILITVENKVPDVSAWFGQHLIEALLSLLLVAVAAFAFQRFRNAFGA
jgi:ABC-type transport system involved in multi-copper enzyme maturation permease subunit